MNSLLRPPLPGPTPRLSARRRVSSPAPVRVGSAVLAGGGRRCQRGLAVAASAAPSWMEEAGVAVLEEGGRRNPSVSDSYRAAGLPQPNATVLDAQARVCTGPAQTRPLGEEQAMRVLDTILRSGEYGQLTSLDTWINVTAGWRAASKRADFANKARCLILAPVQQIIDAHY
jgi:hypothetical protein